jgi:uncharacterized protein
MNKTDEIIFNLRLTPHPEGGFYRETYRSPDEIEQDDLAEEFKGRRSFSTCIYFLLTSDTFSAFHKIRQDEIWHFYDGSPLRLHMINDTGIHSEVIIGKEFGKGQIPQFVIPAGTWFAAKVINENDHTLLGCTVSPGFDFKDFTLAIRNDLIKSFPQHTEIITQLTRN